MILDSNIVIYAVIPEYENLRNFLKKHEYELAVSSITKLEVLGYHKLSNKEREILEKFFDAVHQIPVSQTIIDKAVALRQKQKMSIGDAILLLPHFRKMTLCLLIMKTILKASNT